MKRIIFVLVLLVLPYTVKGQVVMRSDRGVMSVSSTVVTKTRHKKENQKFDARTGLTHIAEFHPKLYFNLKDHISLSYIAGWRFNNWFLAGLGTGLDFATSIHKGMKNIAGTGKVLYSRPIRHVHLQGGAWNLISIPLYAHAKFFYMRTRWTPYSSVSLGGRLAPKDCGIYFDVSTGVNYIPPRSFTEKYKISSLFAAIGFTISEFQTCEVDDCNEVRECEDSRCPYYAEGDYHYHYSVEGIREQFHGLSLRVGISF